MKKVLKKAAGASGLLVLAVVITSMVLPACGPASPATATVPATSSSVTPLPSSAPTIIPSPVATTTAPTPVTSTGKPMIFILQPPPGAYEFLNNVRVSVRLSNFRLVDRTGQADVPGEGHLIYYVDVQPPTTPGQPALTAPGTYAISVNTSFLWPRLFQPGPYTLSVQVVNNDNTPLSPPVTAQVDMNVND